MSEIPRTKQRGEIPSPVVGEGDSPERTTPVYTSNLRYRTLDADPKRTSEVDLAVTDENCASVDSHSGSPLSVTTTI